MTSEFNSSDVSPWITWSEVLGVVGISILIGGVVGLSEGTSDGLWTTLVLLGSILGISYITRPRDTETP